MRKVGFSIGVVVLIWCFSYLSATSTNAQVLDFFTQPTATPVPQAAEPTEEPNEASPEGELEPIVDEDTAPDAPVPTNTPLPPEPEQESTADGDDAPSVTPATSLEGTDETGVYVTNGSDTVGLRDGDLLFVGGRYSRISLEDGTVAQRQNLGVINVPAMDILGWDPQANERVRSLASDEQFLFVAGHFTQIAGEDRAYIGLFDKQTLELLAWNPLPNDRVYAIGVDAEYIYVGGRFTAIGGINQPFFAIFDRSTGELAETQYAVDGPVGAIRVSDGVVFIGGEFTQVNGEDRSFIAALNPETGQVTPFNPEINSPVRRIEVTDEGVVTIIRQTNDEGQQQDAEVVIDPETAEIVRGQAAAQGNRLTITVKVDQSKLGFTIPTLSDVLTFIIRGFFIIAGLAALFYLLLGAFSWVTSGGEEENVKKARDKITAAIIGVILIVVVLSVIVTLEQVVFQSRICFGLSCAASIPDLVEPCGPGTCDADCDNYFDRSNANCSGLSPLEPNNTGPNSGDNNASDPGGNPT